VAVENVGGGGSGRAAAAPPVPAPSAASGSPSPRRRGRPRSEQVEDAILDAVIGLLSDGATFDSLSMETIAGTAGVGKAAIYRRWANKEALVIATLQRTFHRTPHRSPPGISVREDLIDLASQMRRNMTETQEGTAFAVLLQTLAGNKDLMCRYKETVIEPRRDQYREVLRRGAANGELRPDLDIERTVVTLTATLLFICKLYPTFEVTEDYCVGLVDDILRGAAPRPPEPAGQIAPATPIQEDESAIPNSALSAPGARP
jgi:AcrR family transcriptional regulator